MPEEVSRIEERVIAHGATHWLLALLAASFRLWRGSRSLLIRRRRRSIVVHLLLVERLLLLLMLLLLRRRRRLVLRRRRMLLLLLLLVCVLVQAGLSVVMLVISVILEPCVSIRCWLLWSSVALRRHVSGRIVMVLGWDMLLLGVLHMWVVRIHLLTWMVSGLSYKWTEKLTKYCMINSLANIISPYLTLIKLILLWVARSHTRWWHPLLTLNLSRRQSRWQCLLCRRGRTSRKARRQRLRMVVTVNLREVLLESMLLRIGDDIPLLLLLLLHVLLVLSRILLRRMVRRMHFSGWRRRSSSFGGIHVVRLLSGVGRLGRPAAGAHLLVQASLGQKVLDHLVLGPMMPD